MKSPSIAYAPNEYNSQWGYRYTCLSVLLVVNWEMLRLLEKTTEIYILSPVGETIIGLCSQNSDVDARKESITLLTHNIDLVSIYNYYIIFNTTFKVVIIRVILLVFVFRPTNSYRRIPHSHNHRLPGIYQIIKWNIYLFI